MSKVFIIAEIGHNGNGNMRLNKLLIDEAKACGADAVKFQLYDVDKIKKPWQSRYLELKMAELTYDDAKELREHAHMVGIEWMASAFDPERVRWCETLGVKRHKLASRCINDKYTIKAMEKKGKPIIVSLGAVGYNEVPFRPKNAQYLYCISEYPAYIAGPEFPAKFGDNQNFQGFSDHTLGCYWAREAIKRGATIIEKHFTLSHELPGHNQKGSAEPWELKDLCVYARQHERGITY